MRLLLLSLLFLVTFTPSAVRAAEPVRLILDTDMGNDIDDAMALALIHSLQNRSEVQLLAVTVTKDNQFIAPYISLVNTFYGRGDIPIGVVRQGKTPANSDYARKPVERRDSAGHYVYPRSVATSAAAPDAVAVLRKVLSAQPDHSVTIAQIGFSTNLARLLKSEDGSDLARRKVKLLCFMAGNFQKAEPEYNVYTDPEAAQYVFSKWPTPMIFSGFEIGLQVRYSVANIAEDFKWAQTHPVAESLKIFLKPGENRPNWDSTAVFYAIEPNRKYFTLSEPGFVTLGAKSTTVFKADPKGNSRYLKVTPDQAARVESTIEALVSEPPQAACAPKAAK